MEFWANVIIKWKFQPMPSPALAETSYNVMFSSSAFSLQKQPQFRIQPTTSPFWFGSLWDVVSGWEHFRETAFSQPNCRRNISSGTVTLFLCYLKFRQHFRRQRVCERFYASHLWCHIAPSVLFYWAPQKAKKEDLKTAHCYRRQNALLMVF